MSARPKFATIIRRKTIKDTYAMQYLRAISYTAYTFSMLAGYFVLSLQLCSHFLTSYFFWVFLLFKGFLEIFFKNTNSVSKYRVEISISVEMSSVSKCLSVSKCRSVEKTSVEKTSVEKSWCRRGGRGGLNGGYARGAGGDRGAARARDAAGGRGGGDGRVVNIYLY